MVAIAALIVMRTISRNAVGVPTAGGNDSEAA
jgi:hypothetical protein